MTAPLDDNAMTGAELCAALRLAMSTFYQYQSLGRFERFELVPRIGPRRYSRKLVKAYLDGEPSTRTRAPRLAEVRRA
jgi:hypothetical protein